jgi:hypothetical protein
MFDPCIAHHFIGLKAYIDSVHYLLGGVFVVFSKNPLQYSDLD